MTAATTTEPTITDEARARLLKSREVYEENEMQQGRAAGVAWAFQEAEYRELKLVKAHFGNRNNPSLDHANAYEFEQCLGGDTIEELRGDNDLAVSNEFVGGFIEGALQVLEEIE